MHEPGYMPKLSYLNSDLPRWDAFGVNPPDGFVSAVFKYLETCDCHLSWTFSFQLLW